MQIPELGNPSGYFADRYSFSGVAGQAVAITATSTAFTPYLFLLHGSDGSQVTSTYGSPFARIPSGDGFFVLPATDTYFLERSFVEYGMRVAFGGTLMKTRTADGVTGSVQRGGVGDGGESGAW